MISMFEIMNGGNPSNPIPGIPPFFKERPNEYPEMRTCHPMDTYMYM